MISLEKINKQVLESLDVTRKLSADESTLSLIAKAAEVCTEAYKKGNKVLFAGNGGSAADAQHFAGELVSKFYFNRPGMPAMSLSTDTSILTSIGNDFGFERVFARQIEAQGVKGDIFVGLSTSGNSSNIVEAMKTCQQLGITTIGLTGINACKIDDLADIVIKAPSSETPRIQECHTLIGHILCCLIEENIFPEYKPKD